MSPLLKMLLENEVQLTAAIEAGCNCSGCRFLRDKLFTNRKLIADERKQIEQTKAQSAGGKNETN